MRTILAVLILLFASTAAAHDPLYDMECCHNLDCAPVLKAEMVAGWPGSPLPVLLVTTSAGTVMVPPSFPRRMSKDGRMHACIRPGDGGTARLICIYLPPSN